MFYGKYLTTTLVCQCKSVQLWSFEFKTVILKGNALVCSQREHFFTLTQEDNLYVWGRDVREISVPSTSFWFEPKAFLWKKIINIYNF
jgi:hypothetical protein